MRRMVVSLIILGLLLVPRETATQAATPTSDWPSLGADAAQSNDNAVERALTSKNILKLKVRWSVPIPDVSYPVVAGGRVYVPVVGHAGSIHARALDAVTGKQVALYTKDALGGLLVGDGNLYLAGHVLQAVQLSSGNKVWQIDPSPKVTHGIFLDPIEDSKLILSGYAGTRPPASIYAVDPESNHVLWKSPSISASAAIGKGHILTRNSAGGVFYDESSGKQMAREPAVYGDWFAGDTLAYTIASVNRHNATVYAYDGQGHKMWSRGVGPYLSSTRWPHAVSSQAVYVQTFKPQEGVEALDPLSGKVLWSRRVVNVESLALANGLLLALTYGLGEPVRIVALKADTGTMIGAVVLSSGFYAFSAPNGLMVADGMVFIRAVGSAGTQYLLALSPQK